MAIIWLLKPKHINLNRRHRRATTNKHETDDHAYTLIFSHVMHENIRGRTCANRDEKITVGVDHASCVIS